MGVLIAELVFITFAFSDVILFLALLLSESLTKKKHKQ